MRVSISASVLLAFLAACSTVGAQPEVTKEVSYMHADQPTTERVAQTCLAVGYALEAVAEAVNAENPLKLRHGYLDFWNDQLLEFAPALGVSSDIEAEANAYVAPLNEHRISDGHSDAYMDLLVDYGLCWIRQQKVSEAPNG